MLQGTVRDHVTLQRRPFVRFFACQEDLSHDSPDAPLPDAVASGAEPFRVVAAVAGGERLAAPQWEALFEARQRVCEPARHCFACGSRNRARRCARTPQLTD